LSILLSRYRLNMNKLPLAFPTARRVPSGDIHNAVAKNYVVLS
jgi:hypothetical protein